MHRLLRRLLKKSGLDTVTAPPKEKWLAFLERVDETFASNDEDRYLLERSLEISSREMEDLLDKSRESYRRRLSALIEAIPDLIFYVDEEGRYLDVLSQGHEDALYLPRERIVGRTIEEVFPKKYADLFFEATRKAIETHKTEIIEYTMKIGGEPHIFEARIAPTFMMENGKRTSMAIVRDITAQKRSMDYLGVIRKIFEDATEGILIISKDGTYVEANDAFCRMIGEDRHCRPGPRVEDFRNYFDEATLKEIRKNLDENDYFRGEVTIHRRGMPDLLAWITIDTVFDEKEEAAYRVAMLTDISELQKSREKLRYTATHDALTGLPNRALLFEHLQEVLARTKRSENSGALLFIDLDNFKEVNDTSGHKAGDLVLEECARRIRSVVRESDILGRLGGDEFLLILENIENSDVPMHVAKKIIDEINRPYSVEGNVYELGASIGIALFPADSREQEELVQFADMAMYRAKEEGKNRFEYYSRNLDSHVKRHYMIESALKKALSRESFYLLFQPQQELETGRITGVEALLRVDEAVMGLLSPAEFIPVAEESDLILKIGRWVFDACCRQIAEWGSGGTRDLTVAINLSRRQLMDDTWCDFVKERVRAYDIPPERIEMEITETTFMHSREIGLRTIKRLQSMGFRFSIDDFGTGYSSLANLKHFMVDKLKIDKSFITDFLTNKSDRAIVNASIALAHAIGLRVIAEGVESEEQKALLRSMGCDEIQGYLFSRPLPPEEIPSLVLL
ncbi:EAL domain-containing protein [Hydrogenimonas sp. SS33]|uniref:putative bifunctional diguanylate cyclase/phosphodiesterase n=1 Tax=Hydrogenimonas leucolamina TaxID=2954236 RepID=UPI00336BDFE9